MNKPLGGWPYAKELPERRRGVSRGRDLTPEENEAMIEVVWLAKARGVQNMSAKAGYANGGIHHVVKKNTNMGFEHARCLTGSLLAEDRAYWAPIFREGLPSLLWEGAEAPPGVEPGEPPPPELPFNAPPPQRDAYAQLLVLTLEAAGAGDHPVEFHYRDLSMQMGCSDSTLRHRRAELRKKGVLDFCRGSKAGRDVYRLVK